MKCRICDAETKIFAESYNISVQISMLITEPSMPVHNDVSLYICTACGHLQIPYINSNNYYEDYLMTTSYSSKMQQMQQRQIEEIARLALHNKYFFEVGCGDGSFLQHAQNYFAKVIGVEPSKKFYQVCIKESLDVINDYFTDAIKFDFMMDAFASRQVFEHVTDPKKLLSDIYSCLTYEGVGLIEVPNGQKMISQNRYYDIFSDHVNYFTPQSLCKLATMVKFDIISVAESFNGDYLEMYVRKVVNQQTLKEKQVIDLEFIQNNLVIYSSIAIWGAGAKSHVILSRLVDDNRHIKYIFDSDPNKQRKYLPGNFTIISDPTREKIEHLDLIIITAISYQDEIIKLLRDIYKFNGDIMCLEGEPCILKR